MLSLTGLDFNTSISGAATSISNVGQGLGTIIGAVFGVGIIAYMEIGIIAIGWSGTWRQFFNGLIILLALLGHRLHGERVR